MKATDLFENAIILENKSTLTQVKLQFDRDALDPVISKDALDYHYGKLYHSYVERFNSGLGDPKFNEAGAYLHGIYFSQLRPPKGSNKPSGMILDFITNHYKSYEKFQEDFGSEAMSIQGSGWVYLSKNGEIKKIKNHAMRSDILLLIDWWEHAMYDYKWDKIKYLQNTWKIIDWDIISQRL